MYESECLNWFDNNNFKNQFKFVLKMMCEKANTLKKKKKIYFAYYNMI